MSLFARKPEEHDDFLELCALSTSGELTNSERESLDLHLAECRGCREAMKQFNSVVARTIPAIGAEYTQGENETTSDPSWSQESALEDLLARLPERREAQEWRQQGLLKQAFTSSQTWRTVWTLYAAGILLFASLGILLYKMGVVHGTRTETVASHKQDETRMLQRVGDGARQADATRAQLRERDQVIFELRRSLQQQFVELRQFRAEQERLSAELRDSESARNDLATEESGLQQKAEIAEAQVNAVEAKLRLAEAQATADSARTASWQAQIADLQQSLDAKAKAINEQEELLAHDRDIRELMGERDLYISEVYDVDGTGTTRKPYGRVFYTKGKSLVFYAYDLDQQRALKNASFQAWGRLAEDRQKDLSLGMFYQDNAAKKRWVLKTSDPQVLSRIDEVFVTVEPSGGSNRPSNRRILFAYLNFTPNHP